MLQSVLLLYLQHHLCNIRLPHSYLSSPGDSGRGIRQKIPVTLVCQSIILPNDFCLLLDSNSMSTENVSVHEKLTIGPTVTLEILAIAQGHPNGIHPFTLMFVTILRK